MRALAPSICVLFSAGCAYVGEPLPPALNIPQPVKAVQVEQVGGRIEFRFALPEKTTENLPVEIRGIELLAGGTPVAPIARAAAAATASLPAESWLDRRLIATARVQSKQGKWSVPSPPAAIDVVAPVEAPAGVKAEAAPTGARVTWRKIDRTGVVVRIERTPSGSFEAPGSAAEWIDPQARFGEEQQYRVTAALGATARSETIVTPRFTPVDRFPPSPPLGLSAVPGLGSIELSWDRPPESDLAGFRVYRTPAATPNDWTRVSFESPAPAAAFSDRGVQRGTAYVYSVSSVDSAGNESPRTSAVEATAP